MLLSEFRLIGFGGIALAITLCVWRHGPQLLSSDRAWMCSLILQVIACCRLSANSFGHELSFLSCLGLADASLLLATLILLVSFVFIWPRFVERP